MGVRILLIRHGATLLSKEDRFAGSSDVELSEEGVGQAELLGARLGKVKIDALYCSPMRRAMVTAACVGRRHGLVAGVEAGLREVDHGHWEGMVHQEVEEKFAQEYRQWDADPLGTAPPGGETGLAVLARALPALREIVAGHAGQTVAVVSHKATNRLLISAVVGLDLREYRATLGQDLACLNVLEFREAGRARLVVLNDTSHYGGGMG